MPLLSDMKQFDRTMSLTAQETYHRLLTVVVDSNNHLAPLKNLALGKLRAKDYIGLLGLADSLCEQQYRTVEEHYSMNQFAALIRKYPFSQHECPGLNPEARAFEKFIQAENSCKRYNRYFRLQKTRRERFSQEKHIARNWIAKVIGFSPDLPAIYSECGFGPGASVGVTGNATNMGSKLRSPRWSVTPSASFYALSSFGRNDQLKEFLLHDEGCTYPQPREDLAFGFTRTFDLARERMQLVDYNKITFVPKTTTVHRSIAVEPLLNGWIQTGIDRVLRQRLRRVGINLADQSRNQKLAKEGSEDSFNPFSFCTIDLSSASDSISTELVRDLLPPAWFELLNACRSKNFMYKGIKAPYHKFVSMGNGFCFPLQSLIFAAICHAAYMSVGVNGLDFSVYGDDIIVVLPAFRLVSKLLRHCGFRLNPRKTFYSGPFRESCGKDYFEGQDVRPINLDFRLESLETLIKFYNATRSSNRTETFFAEVRDLIWNLVPPKLQVCRPYPGNADSAFEVAFDVFMVSPFARWRQDIFSWSWTELIKKSYPDKATLRCEEKHLLVLMACLRGSPSSNTFTLRRKTRTVVRRISHGGSRLSLIHI